MTHSQRTHPFERPPRTGAPVRDALSLPCSLFCTPTGSFQRPAPTFRLLNLTLSLTRFNRGSPIRLLTGGVSRATARNGDATYARAHTVPGWGVVLIVTEKRRSPAGLHSFAATISNRLVWVHPQTGGGPPEGSPEGEPCAGPCVRQVPLA